MKVIPTHNKLESNISTKQLHVSGTYECIYHVSGTYECIYHVSGTYECIYHHVNILYLLYLLLEPVPWPF